MQMKNAILFFFMLHYTSTHGYMIGQNQLRKIKRSDLDSFSDSGGGGCHDSGSGGCSDISSSGCSDIGSEEEKQKEKMVSGSSSSTRQKATSIAQKAAQEAKAAEEAQTPAGAAASHAVKEQLAERAHQAAVAAEAALAGKKSIDDELEHEVHEAEGVVQEEASSMQNAEIVVQAAVKAHEQAKRILQLLTDALRISQTHVGNAETAAQGAQAELAEKQALVDAAKNRVELLLRQLRAARADLSSTQQAESCAEHSAHAAKENANRVRRRLFRD